MKTTITPCGLTVVTLEKDYNTIDELKNELALTGREHFIADRQFAVIEGVRTPMIALDQFGSVLRAQRWGDHGDHCEFPRKGDSLVLHTTLEMLQVMESKGIRTRM